MARMTEMMFQSLFWWNVLLNFLRQHTPGARLSQVSILVLVECTSELTTGDLYKWMNEVSILVLVECTSEFYRLFLRLSETREFQSLFWWNVLLNQER